MPNEDQIASWDGAGGEHWAAEADRYDRMSSRFADLILDRLAAEPGDHILDVGCGNGALALAIAALVEPGGSVTGLDISTPMLDVARRRATEARLGNVTFVHGDAQVHALERESLDAVVSRFGVMFFEDPQTAFANLASALRPGGRMTFVCWRELLANEWIMCPVVAALEHVPMPELGEAGGPGPFSLADPTLLRSVLEGAGLTDVTLEEVTLPVTMGADLEDALDFMTRSEMAQILFEGREPEAVDGAWQSIRDALAGRVTPEGLTLDGAAWLVGARRGE